MILGRLAPRVDVIEQRAIPPILGSEVAIANVPEASPTSVIFYLGNEAIKIVQKMPITSPYGDSEFL